MLQAERPLIMHASLRFQPRTAPAATSAAAVIRKRRFSLFFGHFACLDDNTQNQQQQEEQQHQQLAATTTGSKWQLLWLPKMAYHVRSSDVCQLDRKFAYFLCAQGQQQAQLAQECFLRCLRGEEASKLALNYVRGRGVGEGGGVRQV